MASPKVKRISFEDDFGLPTPILCSSSSNINKDALTAPLLSASATERSGTTYGTMPSSSARPALLHRAATTASTTTDTAAPPTTPQLARPIATRQDAVRPSLNHTATAPARPGLIHRLSSSIAQTLDLAPSPTTYTADNHPKRPSYWTDHAYRATLLRTWDRMREDAESSDPKSVSSQLGAVKKAMVEQFPELGAGDVVLRKEWMTWVLGRALRQPFCTEGGMGRW